MTYKGQEITAECKGYDEWTLNNDGELDDWQNELDGFEVVGYRANGDFFETLEEAKEYIDGLGAA